MQEWQVEPGVSKLFEGHISTFIDCIAVDYTSMRMEAFMDLQLDVKGCKDVLGSFDRYTQVDTLKGQNQFRAEGFGLQVRMTLVKVWLSCLSACHGDS